MEQCSVGVMEKAWWINMANPLASIFALLFILFSAVSVSAQDRVRVGWAAMTASHTPLWVAQDRGFLAKQGLAVESIFFGAGPPAMQALVAGDLDIVVTSAPNVVNPRLGGVDAVMILSIIPLWMFWLAQWTWGRVTNGAPKRFDELMGLPIEAPALVTTRPAVVAHPATHSNVMPASRPEAAS